MTEFAWRIFVGVIVIQTWVPLLWWTEDLQHDTKARWPKVVFAYILTITWLFAGMFAIFGLDGTSQ